MAKVQMFPSRSLALYPHWAPGPFMRLVENIGAPADNPVVVRVGVRDPHVGPSVADVAAVEHLGLIGLCDGHPAVPSDLGRVVGEPHNLKVEQVVQFSHCALDIAVGKKRADHRFHRSDHLEGQVWELRVRLAQVAVRVTYWCRPDGTIVMLTVFRKTRQHDQRQIDRAVRAQQACERHHRRPAGHTYERQA
ncbi:MAG: type II toxin-antitoxin system RelE/ParE family toxin [Streptosporangiaceae bacterium]